MISPTIISKIDSNYLYLGSIYYIAIYPWGNPCFVEITIGGDIHCLIHMKLIGGDIGDFREFSKIFEKVINGKKEESGYKPFISEMVLERVIGEYSSNKLIYFLVHLSRYKKYHNTIHNNIESLCKETFDSSILDNVRCICEIFYNIRKTTRPDRYKKAPKTIKEKLILKTCERFRKL